MNTGMARTLVLVFALAPPIVVLAESSEAQKGEWKIGPRTLPVSGDVSAVMRESLMKTPAPDAVAARRFVPQTVEHWEALINERDAGRNRPKTQEPSVRLSARRCLPF